MSLNGSKSDFSSLRSHGGRFAADASSLIKRKYLPSPSLRAELEAALESSEFLLLLASPAAASASWVDWEVKWWLQHKSVATLLIVHCGGTVAWDDRNQDFSWDTDEHQTDALPRRLQGAFRDVPRWTDLRGIRADRSFRRDARLQDAVAEITARIEGLSKHELVAHDTRQHRRLTKVGVTLAAVAALAVVATYFEYQLASRESEAGLALDLASESELTMREANQTERSALLALESTLRVHLPENDYALRKALRVLPKPVAVLKHPNGVMSISVSADGNLFATGGRDGVTRIFRLPDSTPVAESAQKGLIFSVKFSPDSRLVLSGSADKTARLIDAQTGRALWSVQCAGRVSGVAFSPDGRSAAIGTEDGEVQLVDILTGKPSWRRTLEGFVGGFSFSPDGQHLAVPGEAPIAVLKASNGSIVPSGPEDRGASDAAFSPDGKILAIINSDDNLRLLSTATWKEHSRLSISGPISRVVFTRDSSRVALSGRDGVVRIIRLSDGRETLRYELGTQTYISWLAFNADARYLGVASFDKTARVIDTVTGIERWRVGHQAFVLAGTFSPNGRYLITGGDDDIARVSEINRPEEIVSFAELSRLAAPVSTSADGRYHAVVTDDGTLRVLEAPSKSETLRLSLEGKPTALEFQAGSKNVVLALENKGIRMIAHDDGHTVWNAPVAGQVSALAVSRSGEHVVLGGWSRELIALNGKTGNRLWTNTYKHAVLAVAISGDGRRVAAVGGDPTVRVFDTATGATVWTRDFGIGGSAVALSHDGGAIAVGLADFSLRVLRLETGHELLRMANMDTLSALAFSRDGRNLATGSNDKSARVFDLTRGVEVSRIGHDNALWGLSFSDDDHLVATESYHTILRHPLRPQSLVAQACARLSRGLTPEEWGRYLGNRPYRPACAGDRPSGTDR